MDIHRNPVVNKRLDNIFMLFKEYREAIILSRKKLIDSASQLAIDEEIKKGLVTEIEGHYKASKKMIFIMYNLFSNRYKLIDTGLHEIKKLATSTEPEEEKRLHQKLIDAILDEKTGTVANMDRSMVDMLKALIHEKNNLTQQILESLDNDPKAWQKMFR